MDQNVKINVSRAFVDDLDPAHLRLDCLQFVKQFLTTKLRCDLNTVRDVCRQKGLYREHYLADPIDEVTLIFDIHGNRFIQGACSSQMEIGVIC